MGLVLAFIIHMFLTYSVDNRALNHVILASSSSWLQEHMTDISERYASVVFCPLQAVEYKTCIASLSIPANFLEFQRVTLLAKPQFTGFFRDILRARTFLEQIKSEIFFINI